MTAPDHDRQIDYVEFAATDLAATKRFDVAVFGWRFEAYGPDYTSFQDGRLAGGGRRDQPVQPGGPLVVIYGRDLEQLATRVKQAGGSIVREPFSFLGGRRFHFRDPRGNELAVWSDH
jgi:predicted enzyme related to lactoylglutathione lyase